MKSIASAFPFSIEFFTGALIALHGISKILFISSFTDYIVDNLYGYVPSEGGLIIVGSLLPFLEFFAGLLILFKVKLRQSILLALVILGFLSLIIIANRLYIHLVFEVVVFVLLVIISIQNKLIQIKQSS